MKLKESDDLRAPLAFLLGRLDFEKDFKTFQSKPDGADTVIQATPKSDKLPYKAVEFSVTPAAEIRRLIVTGHDNSLLTFNFANERVNPSVDDKLFRFEPPPGATWVDSAGDTQ
jgi:outer membrane lipoprotein carrier protein